MTKQLFMTLRQMQDRYSFLVKEYDYERADEIMDKECANWESEKHQIWIWYDCQSDSGVASFFNYR